MPHTYQCPLRWADMDLLGHVNNVTYLDYVTEARQALFAGHPVASASVLRHQVDFVKPLVFHREPVLVDTWVTDIGADQVTLAHEVYDVPAGERQPTDHQSGAESDRTVYLRATTVLDHRLSNAERAVAGQASGPAQQWRPVPREARSAPDVFALTVRRSDIDERGRARAGVFFEYVQEARIRYLMRLHTRGEQWSAHVVARTDIDYLAPLAYRQEPYAVHTWVAHVGSRSFTLCSEVRDGDAVLASAAVVMVTFDLETQQTAAMTDEQRARLVEALGTPS